MEESAAYVGLTAAGGGSLALLHTKEEKLSFKKRGFCFLPLQFLTLDLLELHHSGVY